MKSRIAEYVVASLMLFVVLWFVLFSILHIFYPIKYGDYVHKYSMEYNLDSSLVFSVMKSESGFKHNVVSSKDAVGLMQITPDTGEWIAENMDIDDYSLMNPETNIMFSCWYLDYLTERFDDVETAIAAYNAGEGNVDSWLENPDFSADGVTLLSIPYSETDKYVKKVMNAYNIYNKLY